MNTRNLSVLIAGKLAGTLTQDATGSLSFAYSRDYRDVPLSSAMPLSTGVYRDKVVRPYVWGLLPEDPAARQDVAVRTGVSPNNPFALLSVMGLDCPGAVQFCQSGSDADREERLVPISDREIARRLTNGQTAGSGWLAASEHWSLGGQQAKFALRREGGRWYSCEGAAATTHILKSGVRGLNHQALNEYVCLELARSCGIPSAKADYCEFPGEDGPQPAIVVERYDRRRDGQGAVMRVHQEDMCQALGCLPDNKYTMYGGPGTFEVLSCLLATGDNARENVAEFLQMLFFNYLIVGTDAHAKNYSILLDANGAHRIAPLYDVASIAPYSEVAIWDKKPPRLAMSIGGENRVGRLRASNLSKMVEQCELAKVGFTAEGCANLLGAYAQMIPERLANVFEGLGATAAASAAKELRLHMESPIKRICDLTVARL